MRLGLDMEGSMGRKRHTPEEIVAKLRQVDVLVSQGQTVDAAPRSTASRRPAPRRAAAGRDLLQPAGGAGPDRGLAAALQRCPAPLGPRLSATGPGGGHSGRLRSPDPLRRPPQPSSSPQSTNIPLGAPIGGWSHNLSEERRDARGEAHCASNARTPSSAPEMADRHLD